MLSLGYRARAAYLGGSEEIYGELVVTQRSNFPHVWLVDEVISTE